MSGMVLKSRSLRSAEVEPVVKRRKLDLQSAVGGVDEGVVEHTDSGINAAAASTPTDTVTSVSTDAIQAMPATKKTSLLEAEWYYLSSLGTFLGPYTADDLKDLYELDPTEASAADVPPENMLSSASRVWAKDVLPEWMPIEKVTELYEFLEGAEQIRQAQVEEEPKEGKKKKGGGGGGGEGSAASGWVSMNKTTAVYVSCLPEKTVAADLEAFFKKLGHIKDDVFTQQAKIKVYGANDGLVTFEKRASVDLAIRLYDDSDFTNAAGVTSRIKIEEAKFEQKGKEFRQRTNQREYRELLKKSKLKAEARLSWKETKEFDPNQRSIVLKNVFAPEELVKDAKLMHAIRAEVKAMGAKHGAVEHVQVYKESAEGVVLVWKIFLEFSQKKNPKNSYASKASCVRRSA